jgi:hypothetical protein
MIGGWVARKHHLVFALALAGSLFAGIAHADEAAIRKEMAAGFNDSVVAWKRKDAKAFMSMFALDFKGLDMAGKVQTYNSMAAEVQSEMAMTRSVDKASLSIEKVKAKGNTVVMDSVMTMALTVVDSKGEMGRAGATHRLEVSEHSHETWVKSGKRWKLKSSEPLPGGVMKIDGQTLPSTPPPSPIVKPKKR